MPARSKVSQLPKDVLQELHLRVIGSGFAGYEDHAAWLKEQGHDISHAAVWRYFREVQEESRKMLTALSVASITAHLHAALAREAGETYSLATEHMLQVAEYEGVRKALAQGEISVADLEGFQKLSQSQRLTRYRAARERLAQSEASPPASIRAAPESPETPARKPGLSPDTAALIRAAIEGAA